MMSQDIRLPVPVADYPHWRVNVRPKIYDEAAIPELKRCVELVTHNVVRFRGWDYPHWGEYQQNVAYGNDHIASWSDFMGHLEYWRLYQSSQFLHLFTVREAKERAWDQQLRTAMRTHLSHLDYFDAEAIPGFISITNLIYTLTEVVEFTTRMAQSEVYNGSLTLSISINGIANFVLAADANRFWRSLFRASENRISNSWTMDSQELLADSIRPVVNMVSWVVARFGWIDPAKETIAKDVQRFKEGVV